MKQFKRRAKPWIVLSSAIALMGTGTTMALAARPAAHGVQGDPDTVTPLRITLRVYNFPKLPHPWLASAEEAATVIFHRAGIDVTWLDCPLSSSELQEYPACTPEIGFTDFAVRILTRSMVKRISFPEQTLGFGLACADDRRGCYADVFYHRVAELGERGWGMPAYEILGYAMAHEVGHLLLGPNSHSPTGIMRATWDARELQAMSHRRLMFTPAEGQRMRAGVLTRMRREQLVADSSGASAGAR